MDLTSFSPHLAVSNRGQRSGQRVEMMKYLLEYIAQWSACPLQILMSTESSFRETCLIRCSIAAGFSVFMYTVKAKCKMAMTLPLSWSVTDVVSIYLLVWVEQKCNNSATPLKDLKLNMATSECSFTAGPSTLGVCGFSVCFYGKRSDQRQTTSQKKKQKTLK